MGVVVRGRGFAKGDEIMKYTETNKQAWEHAFDNRIEGFGDSDFVKLKNMLV
jgi:hypothetical protein